MIILLLEIELIENYSLDEVKSIIHHIEDEYYQNVKKVNCAQIIRVDNI